MDTQPTAIKMDELIKRLFHLSKKPLLHVLNALYDDHLAETAEVSYGSTEFIRDDLVKSTADMMVEVLSGRTIYRYHIEFQTTYDKNIVIRMFRYGFAKAKELLDLSDLTGPVEMEFPDPRVIFIEENEKIPDVLQLKIKIPKQSSLLYQVPSFKYWLYDARQLYARKMYLLLPLQVFKIRKYLRTRGEMDEEAYQKLLQTAEEVVKAITLALEEEKITPEDAGEMQAIMLNIMEYLYGKYGGYRRIDQEVKNMIKTFYDPGLVEKGRREGIQLGRQEGIQLGRQEGIILILLKQIKKRFGAVPQDIEERINSLELAQLEALAEKILEITTEEELRGAIAVRH
ncbi:DUF4351 domain-containing protein [Desulfofundulus thermobenzoicus]|uniref:DUF4351 domain-containing protein n=1 Tax=Desulfofundulus thermobenzoicus TaxID=29376 RepID=A0A6N7IUC7_9FIRM|nr:DUF4351 domain-containing protein [Desulfofundulus thermobenzoicus]MQL53726.1 DUF4351 domain-containing protein [Desulfofundulus thermobenzoicus]HHW44106.1 DUF4351 domain-containing protein [Desulfotomaculum sp.]